MPYTIHTIELTQSLPALAVPEGDTGIALVLRYAGRPVGFILHELPSPANFTLGALSQLIAERVPAQVLALPPTADVSAGAAPKPSLTIAVCTKDNPKDLAACLDRLLEMRRTHATDTFEILVVDNAPSDNQTREVVTARPGIQYVLEPKPGLDFARNRAIQEATGEFLAFVDDDAFVDLGWLDGFRKVLSEHPDVAAITGLVLPAELQTPAQILFEKRGGFEKKFETVRFGGTLAGHPFYPCVGGKFGTGCNMAFRRAVLIELGGFDEALDAGVTLPGGGDTDMFYRVIRAGYPLVYEPQFLVFHKHRRELTQLRRQYARSWGMGLMAYVAKTYRYDTEQRSNLRRLLIWWFSNGARELLCSLRGKHVLAPDMLLAELSGGFLGLCGAYGRSQQRARQIRRQFPATLNVAVNPSK